MNGLLADLDVLLDKDSYERELDSGSRRCESPTNLGLDSVLATRSWQRGLPRGQPGCRSQTPA